MTIDHHRYAIQRFKTQKLGFLVKIKAAKNLTKRKFSENNLVPEAHHIPRDD